MQLGAIPTLDKLAEGEQWHPSAPLLVLELYLCSKLVLRTFVYPKVNFNDPYL